MEKKDIKNKNSPKLEFQTPKIINKKITLRTTKSTGNIFTKSKDSFSKIEAPLSARNQKNKEHNYIKNKDTLNNINNKIILNKIKEEKNKNPFTENAIIKNNKNLKEDKNKISKQKLESKNLNIIPLPIRKNSDTIKNNNKTCIKNIKSSPRLLNKNQSFTNINENNQLKSKTKLKNSNKNCLKDKEKINKNILKSKNELGIIPIKRNNTQKIINSASLSSRTKKFEFLYVPHIILDPLDVLSNQIEIILQKYKDKIKSLNQSNNENNINNKIKSANMQYANDLLQLYEEKEKELINIKSNYNKEIYNLTYNNGKINEDEINRNREIQIKEVENQFQEKKEKLKNEFKDKIEEIKKLYDINEQIELNKKLIVEMKNKFLKIFNDKNMINKKGINFSLKDYKNSIKFSTIQKKNIRNSSYKKNNNP